jgi:hypothetical protein
MRSLWGRVRLSLDPRIKAANLSGLQDQNPAVVGHGAQLGSSAGNAGPGGSEYGGGRVGQRDKKHSESPNYQSRI